MIRNDACTANRLTVNCYHNSFYRAACNADAV